MGAHAPARRCGRCHQLVSGDACPHCVKAKQQAYDDRRGSAASRGYGWRWAKFRANYLARYPLCGDRSAWAPATGDSECRRDGRVTPATVVDHIVPVTGPNDPRFYAPDAHQALCERCHNLKRQRESQPMTGGCRNV